MHATPQPSDDARLRLLFTASLPVCQDLQEKRKGLSDTFLPGYRLSLIPRHLILTAAPASLSCGLAGGVRKQKISSGCPRPAVHVVRSSCFPAWSQTSGHWTEETRPQRVKGKDAGLSQFLSLSPIRWQEPCRNHRMLGTVSSRRGRRSGVPKPQRFRVLSPLEARDSQLSGWRLKFSIGGSELSSFRNPPLLVGG